MIWGEENINTCVLLCARSIFCLHLTGKEDQLSFCKVFTFAKTNITQASTKIDTPELSIFYQFRKIHLRKNLYL